jgi:hypothetical protein
MRATMPGVTWENDRVITPDTKNWTWVLERQCPECGFDASATDYRAVPTLLREVADRWSTLSDDGGIRPGRTDPTRWSSLEYACHVRDVFRRFDERLLLMIEQDDPLFPNWDQDATAIDDRYDDQDPHRVIADLVEAATTHAARLDGLDEDSWARPGRRSDGASFTVATMSRYMVHDPIHHYWDVTAS